MGVIAQHSAFLVATAAGLCTGIGGLAAVFARKNSQRLLPFSLGFAAGVMIMASLAEILPEAADYIGKSASFPFAGMLALGAMLAGMAVAALGEQLVPEQLDSVERGQEERGILRVGMVTMLAVVIHNVPEGIATYMAGFGDRSVGAAVAFAIALHNIPEGISIAVPVYYGSGSRKKAFWLALASGLGEPLGALIAALFLRPFLSDFLLGSVLGMVAGIMLYVSFDELIPTALRCKSRAALPGILSGLAMMGAGLALFG